MNKKLLTNFGFVVLAVIAGVVTYGVRDIVVSHTSTTKSSTSSPSQANSPTATGPITITGTIVCLAPKNADGPQTATCAIGLQADNGMSYALTSLDPLTVGSLSIGQKYQLTGMFSAQQSPQYDIKGIVNLTSVRRI